MAKALLKKTWTFWLKMTVKLLNHKNISKSFRFINLDINFSSISDFVLKNDWWLLSKFSLWNVSSALSFEVQSCRNLRSFQINCTLYAKGDSVSFYFPILENSINCSQNPFSPSLPAMHSSISVLNGTRRKLIDLI